MEWLGIFVLSLFLIAGVVVIFFGIAGTFVIFFSTLIYGIATGFEKITVPFLLVLLAMTVGLELLEELLSGIMARRFGGSRWAMAGAIIGGFVGAVLGTPVTPVLGTLLGGFLGAFAGAFLLELLHCGDVHSALRTGTGAFIGALGGKITKIIVAVIMVVMVYVRLF